MAKRTAQGFRLSNAERAKAKAEWDRSEEAARTEATNEHIFQEVPSPSPDTFSVEEAPKARTEENQVSAPPINLSPDSLQLAALALGVANSTVVVMFGQDCGLYDNEKKLLYPSLSRVINRMPASSAARASVFIDPLVLLLGLAVWGNRIISIKSKQRNEANAITAREFAAASGVNWDVSRGESSPRPDADTTDQNSTPGAGTVNPVPETGVNPINANGVIGKVPDVIINTGRNDDINGTG